MKIGSNENSRLYFDYPTPRDAAAGVLRLYEQIFSEEIKDKKYTLAEVFNFLDSVQEVFVMMYFSLWGRYDKESKVFRPHGRNYLKAMILHDLNNIR